jgi:hypothetical protein
MAIPTIPVSIGRTSGERNDVKGVKLPGVARTPLSRGPPH